MSSISLAPVPLPSVVTFRLLLLVHRRDSIYCYPPQITSDVKWWIYVSCLVKQRNDEIICAIKCKAMNHLICEKIPNDGGHLLDVNSVPEYLPVIRRVLPLRF